jgi:Ser/Thr protein kinase RdoA (MazF antagonist)
MSDHPFEKLTPDFIMDAIEAQGYACDGRYLTLNSYENRVYQIGIEDATPIIAKFYRPERWTPEQILEEHAFCFELAEQELPIVLPIRDQQQNSLLHYQGFDIALFERKGGHAPELDYADNLTILGRLLARIHAIGSRARYQLRPAITIDSYGVESMQFIMQEFIPMELETAYRTLCEDLLPAMQRRIDEAGKVASIRVHGDCHAGNMLWRDEAPHFVDFDDSRMAPAIQDIWMLLSGDSEQQSLQLKKILDGYHEFNDFNFAELKLIEVFRTLRIMYYSAWLARRWNDPAFPHSFPWFNTTRYWEQHILELREQLAALQQPNIQPAYG